jgi:hypothetical protein
VAPDSVKLASTMTDKAQTGPLNRHGEGQVAPSLPGSAGTKSAILPIGPGRHRAGPSSFLGSGPLLRGTGKIGAAPGAQGEGAWVPAGRPAAHPRINQTQPTVPPMKYDD